jgi:ribosome-binding factor A
MARKDKIIEAIRKEASTVIHDELKDPRLGFITVTGAELSDDLRYGKIFYSVLGSQEQRKNTAEALASAAGFIRKHIAEAINLKFAPEFIFREDRSSEYSARIEEVLNEIKGLETKPRKARHESGKGRRLRKKA